MPETSTTRTEPLRLARPEKMVEARPSLDTPSAEEMFLSPRVLDAGAFARYAELLKSLIADARQGARDLQDFAADADELNAKCDRAGEALKNRLEAGARIVKLVDERADRAAALIETARQALPSEESLRGRVGPIVDGAIGSARAQCDAASKEAGERARSQAAQAENRVRSAATEVEQKLIAMTERAAEQAQRLERAGEMIDARLAAFEERMKAMEAHAERLAGEHEARVADATRAAGEELAPALRRAAEATVTIEDTLERVWRTADERAGAIAQRVEPLQRACDGVLERLGIDRDETDPAGSVMRRLEDMLERSERALEKSDRSVRQVGELTGQAEEVRESFGNWLLEAAAQLDTLEARRERLVGPVAQAAESIARVSPHLAEELDEASTRLDQLQTEQSILREAVNTSLMLARQASEKLTNQSAQLQALIDGSMRSLTQRVEEAGMWLGGLIGRAESLAGPASGGVREPTRRTMHEPTPAPLNTVVAARAELPPSAPVPPALPIDATRFDGADVVYGRPDATPEPAD